MKTSQLMLSTLREIPADAVIASHQLMLRAGLTRKLGNGLYSYMPLGLRSLRKVENIIREELDKAGLLEMKPTVVVPGELWKESGRWNTMGVEMLRAKNRGGQDIVISPTAEEAFTALIRDGLTSYKQLPIIAYQINTKGNQGWVTFTSETTVSFEVDRSGKDKDHENFIDRGDGIADYGWYNMDTGAAGSFANGAPATFGEKKKSVKALLFLL